MQWVTQQRPKIDRLACPWLISRFIDTDPEFLFVPAGDVRRLASQTGAIPFDIAGVELSHKGSACSFDAFLIKYRLADPALDRIATIVRAADNDNPAAVPEAAGLRAISFGLAGSIRDDHDLLMQGISSQRQASRRPHVRRAESPGNPARQRRDPCMGTPKRVGVGPCGGPQTSSVQVLEREGILPEGFPADIKGCMKDCILALMWPRKDIFAFFIGLSDDKNNPLEGWVLQRLKHLEAVLEQRAWLAAGQFTVADILMADALRVPKVRAAGDFPALRSYVDRACARPAFKRAYDGQMAHFAKGDR